MAGPSLFQEQTAFCSAKPHNFYVLCVQLDKIAQNAPEPIFSSMLSVANEYVGGVNCQQTFSHLFVAYIGQHFPSSCQTRRIIFILHIGKAHFAQMHTAVFIETFFETFDPLPCCTGEPFCW